MKPDEASPDFCRALELILVGFENSECARVFCGRGEIDYEARAARAYATGYALMEALPLKV